MGAFRSLDDLEVSGKTVLLRADLNVPMRDGRVTDDTRIRSIIPTIKALLDRGAKVAVLSHFGRPKGKASSDLSLAPVAQPLSEALGTEVGFAPDCIGPAAKAAIAAHDVTLLENLRFHAGEERNDESFARELAALGDAYVGDAFSVTHRAHASVEAIAHLLPSAAGLSMIEELNALENALENPKRPLAALVGGAKISTKLSILGSLIRKVDHLIIGGGMANTFLAAQGKHIGNSLCEKDLLDTALAILADARKQKCSLHLPTDAVVSVEFASNVPTRIVDIEGVDTDEMILDVGPDTVRHLQHVLAGCHTLVWNGPLGAFEVPPFDHGTVALAREAARLTKAGKLLSVAGGGDTVAALNHAGAGQDFSFISTAGGAFLEWLEGRDLPGVAVLRAS